MTAIMVLDRNCRGKAKALQTVTKVTVLGRNCQATDHEQSHGFQVGTAPTGKVGR